MAVQQPPHLNQFPSHHLFPNNRDDIVIAGCTSVHHEARSMNVYNKAYTMMNSSLLPLSGTTTASDAPFLLPPALSSFIVDQKSPLKSTRKRCRDGDDDHDNSYASSSAGLSFLGQDLSAHMKQQQAHVERLIAHHMERVRGEVEEKRRRMVEAMESGVARRLREKEEEVERIGRMNWALQEKLRSLWVENEIWREVAHRSEATANALRTNLEQLMLLQQQEEEESCTGEGGGRGLWMCRNCGREEPSALILPCRHLCLCSPCASSLPSCPLCNSSNTATLHLNLSSSSSS